MSSDVQRFHQLIKLRPCFRSSNEDKKQTSDRQILAVESVQCLIYLRRLDLKPQEQQTWKEKTLQPDCIVKLLQV